MFTFPQVLRPYSNLSNLKIWDYYLIEDLAHGPSYDIEVTQREIRQNEDQEPVETIGQPRRKVINGCYDNILIQQPDNFQWQFQVCVSLCMNITFLKDSRRNDSIDCIED